MNRFPAFLILLSVVVYSCSHPDCAYPDYPHAMNLIRPLIGSQKTHAHLIEAKCNSLIGPEGFYYAPISRKQQRVDDIQYFQKRITSSFDDTGYEERDYYRLPLSPVTSLILVENFFIYKGNWWEPTVTYGAFLWHEVPAKVDELRFPILEANIPRVHHDSMYAFFHKGGPLPIRTDWKAFHSVSEIERFGGELDLHDLGIPE